MPTRSGKAFHLTEADEAAALAQVATDYTAEHDTPSEPQTRSKSYVKRDDAVKGDYAVTWRSYAMRQRSWPTRTTMRRDGRA